MKTTLFATSFALAAFVSAPAFAAASGHVGASVSTTEIDTSFGDANGESYSLSGAVFAPINETLGVQVDVAVSDADDVDPTIRGTAHLVGKVGAHRVGGFVAAADLDGDTMYGIGAEGQFVASEQVTVAGVLGYAKIDDADIDLVGVGAEGRYFVSDNFRLGASLGYLDVQDVDVTAWSGGLDAEYQFTGAPVSVFGGWSRVDVEDVDLTADTFSIGVRYNFGGQTLKGRDRDGASLPGLNAIAGIASIF